MAVTDGPSRKTVVASAIGNILEWYDFAVFGFFAPAISTQFFPASDPIAGLINTFGVFAAGYLVRPLGGIIFGHIGDRIGRRRALQISVCAMAVPTTLMAALPTHAEIGLYAAALLVLLRLVQGVSVGGEFMGSISYLIEVAPPGRRGYFGSWTTFSAVGGMLLGSAVAALIHGLLSPEEIRSWGWRVPFMGGLLVGLFGLWIRLRLEETPEFLALLHHGQLAKSPNLQALRELASEIVHLGSVVVVLAVSIYTLFVWMPTYLQNVLTPPRPHALLINTAAMVVVALLIPLAGRLSDRIGYRRLLVGASLLLAVVVYPLFRWIDQSAVLGVVVAMAVFAVLQAAIQAAAPVTIASMVPAQLRYSAMAMGYNVALAVFGGTAPLVATWMIHKTGDLAAPAWYVLGAAVVSALTAAIARSVYDQGPAREAEPR